MMATISQDYSGIVIDQNIPPTGPYAWRTDGTGLIYQEFTLPPGYGRGVDDLYPDLSGFQVLVAIDEGQSAVATLTATLDYQNASDEWINVLAETIVGAPGDGAYVWFTVPFSASVPITASTVGSNWRIGMGIPLAPGINSVYYTSPAVTVGGATFLNNSPIVGPSASLNFRILALQADSGIDFLGNEYRSLVTTASIGNVSTTEGTTPVLGAGLSPYWMSQILPSPTAVEALYFDQSVNGDPVVIDSILLDPGTPGMSFSVYYSTDDTGTSSNMTPEDWDNKLWSRVPQVYQATSRKQYVFPLPVVAKYMKVELTNPQAQSYDPGEFQVPVVYQQFPTWVTTYFMSSNTSSTTTAASIVNVQYDALNLAYIPYLGDLIQAPAAPIAVPTDIATNADAYWSNNSSNNTAGSATLAQIDLTTTPYQNPLGTTASTSTVVGSIANTVVSQTATSTNGAVTVSEGDPATLPQASLMPVSSSERDNVLIEQSAPVMYFYITCRHQYKQSTALFDYNRGYSFRVNAIAFMRHNYAVAADTPQYIEIGGDSTNMSLNDFTVTNGVWTTYA